MREVTKMIIIWTILKNVHEGGHQNDNNKWIYVPHPSVTIHTRNNGDWKLGLGSVLTWGHTSWARLQWVMRSKVRPERAKLADQPHFQSLDLPWLGFLRMTPCQCRSQFYACFVWQRRAWDRAKWSSGAVRTSLICTFRHSTLMRRSRGPLTSPSSRRSSWITTKVGVCVNGEFVGHKEGTCMCYWITRV